MGQHLPQYKYPLLGRKEEIRDFVEKVKNIKGRMLMSHDSKNTLTFVFAIL